MAGFRFWFVNDVVEPAREAVREPGLDLPKDPGFTPPRTPLNAPLMAPATWDMRVKGLGSTWSSIGVRPNKAIANKVR